MRVWSISPIYLDNIGLARCFNETKLALNCLLNPENKYSNHSQLLRWKKCKNSIQYLTNYLWVVLEERKKRGPIKEGTWKFPYLTANVSKGQMTVTKEQLEYEFNHLQNKLNKRDPLMYIANEYCYKGKIISHPLFTIVPGPIESWERVK